MSENKKAKQSAYEQQESRLSAQSVAFIKLLTQRGILGDTEIDDDKIRQAQKEKKRHTYHNTEMLLQQDVYKRQAIALRQKKAENRQRHFAGGAQRNACRRAVIQKGVCKMIEQHTGIRNPFQPGGR